VEQVQTNRASHAHDRGTANRSYQSTVGAPGPPCTDRSAGVRAIPAAQLHPLRLSADRYVAQLLNRGGAFEAHPVRDQRGQGGDEQRGDDDHDAAPNAIHRATRRNVPCLGIGTDYESLSGGVQRCRYRGGFRGSSMRTMSDAFRARSKTICFPSGLMSKPHVAVW
jgi:hypothetical protein